MDQNSLLTELQHKQYFEKHQKVLIALSGGVDSMNLLHFLSLYQKNLGVTLGIAHVNHKQRPESDQEETYLKELAKKMAIPFYVAHFSGTFTEDAGRQFRYRFFEQIMTEYGYTALVTAHHADDQAETMLMKLLRGSRLRHLTGIKAVQPFGPGELIRPFLSLSKNDLDAVFHFEDASNHRLDYLRNRVRHQYLPLLSQENPQFSQYLTQLAEENQQFQQVLSELLKDRDLTNLVDFQKSSEALQTALLQAYLDQFPDLAMGKNQFNHLKSLLQNDNSYEIPLKSDYHLSKTQTAFTIFKIQPKTDSTPDPKVLKLQESCEYQGFYWQMTRSDGPISLNSDSPILLRHRRAGDQIDFGTFSKKLRRLFIDEKIPKEQRDKAIIGEQDGQVLFVQTANKLYLRKQVENGTMKATLAITEI